MKEEGNSFQQSDAVQAPNHPRYARALLSCSQNNLNHFEHMRNVASHNAHEKKSFRRKRQVNTSYPYEIIYLSPQTPTPSPQIPKQVAQIPKSIPQITKPIANPNIEQLPNCNQQNPETSLPINQSPVYIAPKLEQIRAVYPLAATKRPTNNISCSPEVLTSKSNSIPEQNTVQYTIPNLAQYPVYFTSATPTKPTYKAIPIYVRPPYVNPIPSNVITTKPNVCHCPVVTVPPPTNTVPPPTNTVCPPTNTVPPPTNNVCPPTSTVAPIETTFVSVTVPSPTNTVLPPTNTISPPISTVAPIETTSVPTTVTAEPETSPITTQFPLSSTEPEIITSTETQTTTESVLSATLEPTHPNENCTCSNEKGKNCAFCIQKAIIYISDGFGPKSLALLKDSAKKLNQNTDDDCDDENDDDDNDKDDDGDANLDDFSNDEHVQNHPANVGGIYIQNAVIKSDQSKLLQLIDKLSREINKLNTHNVDSCEEGDDYPENGPGPHDPEYDDCETDDELTASGTAPESTATANDEAEEMIPTSGLDLQPEITAPARVQKVPRETLSTKKCKSVTNGDNGDCECGKGHDLVEAC